MTAATMAPMTSPPGFPATCHISYQTRRYLGVEAVLDACFRGPSRKDAGGRQARPSSLNGGPAAQEGIWDGRSLASYIIEHIGKRALLTPSIETSREGWNDVGEAEIAHLFPSQAIGFPRGACRSLLFSFSALDGDGTLTDK